MKSVGGTAGCSGGFQGDCTSVCGNGCEGTCSSTLCMWGCISLCGNPGSCSADTRKENYLLFHSPFNTTYSDIFII